MEVLYYNYNHFWKTLGMIKHKLYKIKSYDCLYLIEQSTSVLQYWHIENKPQLIFKDESYIDTDSKFLEFQLSSSLASLYHFIKSIK